MRLTHDSRRASLGQHGEAGGYCFSCAYVTCLLQDDICRARQAALKCLPENGCLLLRYIRSRPSCPLTYAVLPCIVPKRSFSTKVYLDMLHADQGVHGVECVTKGPSGLQPAALNNISRARIGPEQLSGLVSRSRGHVHELEKRCAVAEMEDPQLELRGQLEKLREGNVRLTCLFWLDMILERDVRLARIACM
jgi:hypothetical protein